MREEDSNWFARWQEELPSPEDLIPLSQTLISPDLALAFDIRNSGNADGDGNNLSQQPHQQPLTPPTKNNNPLGSSDFAADNSAELCSGGADGDETARTLKRPRLVWTPQLHKRFVDAVAHLGIKNAVPKTIMQLMSVDGLTRENVASHLQKYRLYLKRMQGFSGGGGGGAAGVNGGGAGGVNSDTATDRLFASSPVPAHFLHPGARGNSDRFLPYVPVAIHQQGMAVAAAVGNPHLQSHQYHRQMSHFGSPTNGQFEHQLFARQAQPQQVNRVEAPLHSTVPSSYGEDLVSANGGRQVLTLFPTGDR